MTWLVWRQHRGELLGAAVLLAVLGLLLLLHGVPMHEAYERDGVEACQRLMFSGGAAGFGESCVQTLMAFENQYSDLPNQFAAWLPFLPMLAGCSSARRCWRASMSRAPGSSPGPRASPGPGGWPSSWRSCSAVCGRCRRCSPPA